MRPKLNNILQGKLSSFMKNDSKTLTFPSAQNYYSVYKRQVAAINEIMRDGKFTHFGKCKIKQTSIL